MNQSSIPHPIEFILRLIGMWPGASHISAFLIITAFLTFCLTFQILDAILLYRNIISLMSSICATTAEAMFFIKFLTLRKKRRYVENILTEIINDCKSIKTEKEENIILATLWAVRTFFVCTSCIYLSTGAFFVIIAAASYNTESRQFILDSSFPFEADKSPVFEIIFFIHFCATLIGTLGNAFIDSLFIMMIMHASAKIDLVRCEIERFAKIVSISQDKKLLVWSTKKLVDKYQETIEFAKKIEYIFSYQLLIQVVLSTLEICATGFSFVAVCIINFIKLSIFYLVKMKLSEDDSLENVSVTKRMKFIVFFMAGLWVTGVYCSGGDYLRNKNELIQREIHFCKWYQLRPTECKTLWIILIRSQRPMTITAGKFIDLTLSNYTNILKSSASYLSMLRAIH